MKAINMFKKIGFDLVCDEYNYITYVDMQDSKHYITFDKKTCSVYHCLKYEEWTKSEYVIVGYKIALMDAIIQQIKELKKESNICGGL